MTRIFLDADGCPVKDEAYRVAARYKLEVFVVANKPIHVPLHPTIKMQVVPNGPDEADNWIAENIQEFDICVTTDIPLADRCLKKKARILGARGDEFTEDMIGEALATRELMKHLREMGEVRGGPDRFENKDRSNFLSSLDRIIQNITRKKRQSN